MNTSGRTSPRISVAAAADQRNSLSGLQVPAAFARILLEVLSDEGLAAAPLLASVGLAAPDIAEAGFSLPIEKYLRLQSDAARRYGAPGLGLECAKRMLPLHFGVLGFAIQHCQDVRQALRLMNRYVDVLGPTFDQSLLVSRSVARLQFTASIELGDSTVVATEEAVGAPYSLLRSVTNGVFRVQAVSFPFPEPRRVPVYRSFFEGAELRFDAPLTEMTFSARLLDVPIRHNDPLTVNACEERCRSILRKMGVARGIVPLVRRAVIDAMPGACEEHQIAGLVGVSTRSLRRHLAADGTSFSMVVRSVRCEMAKAHLRDTAISIDQIAELVGYSDASNFRRAFVACTGLSPQHYRSKGSR